MIFLSGWPIFRGYVSFREDMFHGNLRVAPENQWLEDWFAFWDYLFFRCEVLVLRSVYFTKEFKGTPGNEELRKGTIHQQLRKGGRLKFHHKYPLGNHHISNQTGSSENHHWLKSACGRGDLYPFPGGYLFYCSRVTKHCCHSSFCRVTCQKSLPSFVRTLSPLIGPEAKIWTGRTSRRTLNIFNQRTLGCRNKRNICDIGWCDLYHIGSMYMVHLLTFARQLN